MFQLLLANNQLEAAPCWQLLHGVVAVVKVRHKMG